MEVGTEQFINPDLFIAGGGPAGLATSIVAARSGLSIVVSDTATPPIDKTSCGGLLPDWFEALAHLGVDFSFVRSFPFMASASSVPAPIPRPRFLMALASKSRAPFLQSLLLRHAETAGGHFLGNTTLRGIPATSVAVVKHDRNP